MARPASPPRTRRRSPGVREPAGRGGSRADLKPLIDYSLDLGASLTKAALGNILAPVRQPGPTRKAALVGIGGDLEHGALLQTTTYPHCDALGDQERSR